MVFEFVRDYLSRRKKSSNLASLSMPKDTLRCPDNSRLYKRLESALDLGFNSSICNKLVRCLDNLDEKIQEDYMQIFVSIDSALRDYCQFQIVPPVDRFQIWDEILRRNLISDVIKSGKDYSCKLKVELDTKEETYFDISYMCEGHYPVVIGFKTLEI